MAELEPKSSTEPLEGSCDPPPLEGVALEEPDGGRRKSKSKKPKQDPRLIIDGLQLSLKGHKQAFVSFTYALTPLMESGTRIDWKILTTEGVESQHVRLHTLQPGDTLNSLATKYRKTYTVAVILINTEDNLELSAEVTEGAARSKKTAFPIALITSEDGKSLKEFVNRHDTGELNAKLEAKNQVHIELKPQPVGGASPGSESTITLNSRKKGFGYSFRRKGRRLSVINLKEEIKNLMFPVSGPVCVSEDEERFKAVTTIFYQYEQTVQRGGQQAGGALFHKLMKHIDEMFARDFPFYLLTAYRVHKKQSFYLCDELRPFVRMCVEKFERLEPVSISKTLETFFIKIEDFNLMFESDNATHSIYQLIEEACIVLMNFSFSLKSQDGSMPLHRAVYYRMLWISAACKCHFQRDTGPRERVDYWRDHLTAVEDFTRLNTDVIQSVKRGVEFGRLLQLPDDASFTSFHMADILTTKGLVRPLNQLREFVIVLEPYVQPEEDFVKNFMTKPRECYKQVKGDWMRAAHSDGNMLAIIQEGVGYLDTIFEVARKRQWQSNSLDEEMKKWLTILLEPVDVTSDHAESYLKDFLTTKAGGVTKHYREAIKREVILKVEDNLSKLSVEQFIRLYKAFLIWPPWIVQKFLKQYKIPEGVKICSNTWNEFFAEFVERFTDAQHHKFVLEFLKSVAKCYLDQGRAKDFLLDLLQLDVPSLFVMDTAEESTSSLHSDVLPDVLAVSVPEEFTHFLSDYIQRNSLHNVILHDIETIWKLIADHSEFQQLILQVLQQELIPESGSLHGPLNVPMKFLLEKCVTTICSGLDSLHDLTSRLTFCWGVVGSCCQKMPLSENLDWITVYYSVIDQLGRIYSIYQSTQDTGDTRSILTEDSMSSEVTECTAEGVSIFFKWISQAQHVLGTWRDKLKLMEVNYDELLLYTKQYSQISRAAVSLSADGLVVDSQYVKGRKQDFLQSFELLNIFLLRYVSGQPEAGWCSLLHILSMYGVKLPPNILLAIKKYVSFPGESPTTAKKALSLDHHVPASISGTFLPHGELQLEITREMTASGLKKLVSAIATFLDPVRDLDFLSFFFLCNSEIFDKHLKLQLRKLDTKEPSPGPTPSLSLFSVSLDNEPEVMKGVHISHLGNALEQTKDFILRLIVGNASYVEIVAEGSLSLRSLEIDEEFNILGQYVDFAKIDAGNAEGLDGVKAMLQLFQYTRHIQVIHSVCKQYSLLNCLEDPNLKELVDLVNILEENRDNLTAKDAIDKMKNVTKVLCLESGQNPRFLDLFSAVEDSTDFHRFVVHEKQFVGKQGQDLFQQQFQLITTQLQHEEYNEAVLNHLFAAFKLITPFTDTEQNFTQLMISVASLKPLDARRQLDTVNRNINLIRLWFSRAEGDTLQGVETELRCVLNSGYYTFIFSASSGLMSAATETGAIQLHYIPHSSLYQNVGEVSETPSLPTEDKWNEEAISDFVRKLGFLDAEGSSGFEIIQFLHINQTATKLLGLYSKLRELGHPNFLGSPLKTDLRCSLSLEEANDMVGEASQLLSHWEKEVTSLRAEYEQLLFFSIPKLLHLYQNLLAPQPDPSAIVHDVGFLFENKPHVQSQLKESVKELLESKPHFNEDKAGSTPMHVVGAFLSALFSNLALSNNSLKRRRRGSVGSMVSRSSSSSQSTHILHSCTGFSQSQLLRLIISIYGGVPESFEVYHCRSTSSEEEIRLFMNPKRATKRPFQYLILEVNKLPYRLQEALVRIHFDLKQAVGSSEEVDAPCVHFVETGPSLLQEMPWLLRMDYKGAEPPLDFAEASSTCKNAALHSDDFRSLQLVYGRAGDGKTHYIENQMKQCPEYLRIAVNEAFTPLSAIKKLCSMELDEPECAIFFNFTLLPPGEAVSKDEMRFYDELIESIGWFFFHLFILGYVEDPATGHSFRFPGGMQISIYVEVPSRVRMDSETSLKEFQKDIPSLGLLGTKYFVEPNTPFVVDPDVQLVCKYLKAYKTGGTRGIDRLYKDGGSSLFGSRKPGVPVKFSLDADLSESECRKQLDRYTPHHMKTNKATQKLFIKYMKRRCAFLDNCPAFNYNPGSTEYVVNTKGERKKNDTSQLGSTLMDTMLKEVSDFCDPLIREDWALKPHHQLIYDFKDGGGSIGLMSLHPDQISNEDKDKFRKIGVQMPSMFELYSRDCLDSFLSRALDVPLNESKRLGPIDDSAYVLTLDFALKMLNIHERAEGGVPVIIEGETGVGKTALIEMLSKLWNFALFNTWGTYKDRIMDHVKEHLQKLPASSFKKHAGSMESITAIAQSGSIREDDLMQIAEIPLEESGEKQFYSIIRDHLMELAGDPLLSVLEVREEDADGRGLTVPMLVASAQYKDNPKDTARLLYKFLNCHVKDLFFKLNVHAALEPAGIISFFKPIFEQAKTLQRAYDRFTTQVKIPFITVFLDEVNTSACLGLFKEVIIDRTLDGEPIPSNVFIVGACNPHRGNSLAAHGSQETWIRGTYYVRQLHPTMRCLMWDYGALGEQQERDYILAKMKLSNQDTANADLANLTELIVLSQNLMRKYALEQLKECGLNDAKASEYSRSCVSQRDIQRVFRFYEWLYRMYMKYKPLGEQCDYNSRAVAVALGLVYYLRLNNEYRKKYREVLDHEMAPSQLSFSKSFRDELNWYINNIDLPKGIAKTRALKENLFATIICTMTHTPLIIVGSPGSSKTLSFNLTLANLKGQESKVPQFRETDVFKSLDPQIYQCSRRTTSNEISTVFNRAINRQRSHQSIPLPVYCVVFMDEAGLPEERHESLKVLHYYLDTQEVSFVAISNHVLDAAKTNRAVSLFRPEASKDELTTLAKGCLCATPERPPPELRKDMAIVADFCAPYLALMGKPRFARFFGLRDFINFISYLRRKRMEMLSPQLVMEALERNFNGVSQEDFHYICKLFLRAVHSTPESVDSRNILDILCSSIMDHPEDTGAENEMRYKLIIDSSDDGSLVRLLFSTGVLQRKNTRVYVCSDFPGDAELQKVNTIAAIRHSVTEGHTVVLSQTDSIHESFYDLFNRRFHRIDAASGPRYYANIAIGAHIKPCRVHPDFDCVVVVKQSEVDTIPPPFLNRFEKYFLSHELVLEATLSNVPPALAAVLRAALEKAGEFVQYISGSSSLYGLQMETLSSLLMSLLPPLEHDYQTAYKQPTGGTYPTDVKFQLFECLLHALKENAGFQIPSYSDKELHSDADEVLEIIMLDSEFSGQVLRIMSAVSKDSTEIIHNAIVEALHALHFTESIEEFKREVSANACMIVSILTQWLVRHLCKRVMQLMTSEALCMYHRKIPTSYIQAYLNHQHHFSLKELLEAQSSKLTQEKSFAANKLVCFMRSSSPLHQLPAQFPTPVHQPTSSNKNTSLLKELVFTKTQELVVHKMSSITSFSNVNELLKSFVSSSTQRVLLIIINMEDTTKELVNHLRIMIEEAESRSTSNNKLFALLLHFQTCRLASPCYPVMFLPGWDFNYLEMIGYSPRGGVLDIRDWFRQCYGTSSTPDHSIAPHLSALLREAIPAISSRVSFKEHPESPFNTTMKIPERNRALEKLFFDKGVGEVLCERFNSYWTPSVMVEYLEKAALHAQQHESPNVIDNLQTNFKSLFVDFLVYMVYEMNKGMNIDVLFDPDCTRDTIKLFLDIIRVVPIPKLPEITMARVANDTSALKEDNEIFSPPKFPYFSRVSRAIERLVDQTRRDLNQNVNVMDDHDGLLSVLQSSEQSRAQTMSSMFKSLQSKLTEVVKGDEKSLLSVGVAALLSVDSLWFKYLEDFTHQKLHLEFGSTGISHKVLRAAFGRLENRSPAQRLAILHVYVHIHKLNLAKVVSILRPLDQVEDAVLTLTSMATNLSSPAQSLLDDVEDGSDLLERSEALSSFIISTLFNAIAGISMTYFAQGERDLDDREIEQVQLWFKAYRDVMSMPSLREHIYTSRSTTAEAQHSAMHALFLMVRSKRLGDVDTLEHGLRVFNKIFSQYFTTRSDLQGAGPRLENIVSAVLEGLPRPSSGDLSQARGILEGLFSHFFSQYRTVYYNEDIEWFLILANKQTKWQATFIMDEIYEFEYSEDLNSVLGVQDSSDNVELTVEKLASGIPMSRFKFFLRRIILTSTKSTDDPIHSVMLFFNKTEAHKLIVKVLSSNSDLGRSGPYIPTFYQLCDYSISPSPSAENKLMQQPLAHLYFLTVMDDLLDSNYGLSGLVKTVHNISKCEHWFEGHTCNCCDDQCADSSSAGCQLVLLHIEEQAIVQVVIKEVAHHLDPKDSSKINALFAVLPDLNAILDDKWMGGGSVGGHGLTLAMHLLREKKSFQKFVSILTTEYSMLSDGINCLEPFHKALDSPPPASVTKSDTQLFMPYQDMGTDVQLLYGRVAAGMNAVHTSHGSSAKSREKEFVRLADECSTGELNVLTPSGTPGSINKLACFRMSLWLATYNEFFLKKRQSKTLAQIVGSMSKKIGLQCAQLVQCFLDPDLMNRVNNPGESVRPPNVPGPLYGLFSTTPQENHTSSDLQRALVHLITAILASPPNKTNLWYLLFNSEQVTGSYIPGFMYDSPVGPDTKFYDGGVDLTDEGFYAKLDTLKHITRGTLGLHSLYSLLWANFSSFFIALLTQPGAAEKLSGKLFSSSESVQELCSSQMVKLWDLLCNRLNISEEERMLLVGNCLNRFMEQQLTKSPDLRGRLCSTTDLDLCERNWHTKIFTPSWTALKSGFESASAFLKMPVIKDIIKLDARFPWSPDVESLTNVILSSDATDDPSNQLYPLSRFITEYPRLVAGVDLLPSILELYQWLHTELTYAVSYEQATSITLGRLSKVLTKHSMLNGVNRLKEMFNRYVQLTGCTRHMRPETLGEDTPLLHLLSCSSDHSTDLLFTVVKDVITFLNQFFESLLTVLKGSTVSESFFPTSSPKVPVMEFVHHYMLIAQTGSGGDLLQLIHGRTILPIAYPTDTDQDKRVTSSHLPGQLSSLINLPSLQDDILSLCIVGMPLIDPASIDSLRLPFKFKEDSSDSLQHLKLQDYAIDLECIASKLPELFKRPLDDTYRKRLEYEFHCAGYHTVMEVITGLRTAIGHLIKDVSEDKEVQEEKFSELLSQKLPNYLLSLYEYDPQDSTTDVFHEIGINSLSQAQHGCLDGLSLDNLFHTRKLFVSWAEDGLYDFCSLPFGVKKSMNVPDEDTLSQLPDHFEGSPADLLKTLRSLVDVLVHLEPSIVKAAGTTSQRSIVRYLEKLKVCNNMDVIKTIIPGSVRLENYVALRLALRRLITHVQSTVSQSELVTPEPREEKWSDFIQDFWEKRLPHFRRRGYIIRTHSVSSQTNEYVESTESCSKILDELIRFTSERNLLEAFSDEFPPLESSSIMEPALTDDDVKPKEEERSLTPTPKDTEISDKELLRLAKKISVQQVVEFLLSVKLDQYATTFEESDINGELLLQFQDEELEEMEIDSPLNRLKIVVFFKRFLLQSEGLAQDGIPPEGVAKVLQENRQLRPYAKMFLENGVDGDLVLAASDEVMRELGVEKGAHRLMIRNKFNAPLV